MPFNAHIQTYFTNHQFHRDMTTRHCPKKKKHFRLLTLPFMYNKKITIKRKEKKNLKLDVA